MGPSHISPLQDLRLIALCGCSEEQTMQFGFWALTNPDKASVCVFLRFELQAHLPYLVFNFQELVLCVIQRNWVKMCACEGLSERHIRSEGEREGARQRACVSQKSLLIT